MSYGLKTYNSIGQLEIYNTTSLTRLFGVFSAGCGLLLVSVGNVSYYSTVAYFTITGLSAITAPGVMFINFDGYYTISGEVITVYAPNNVSANASSSWPTQSVLTIAVVWL